MIQTVFQATQVRRMILGVGAVLTVGTLALSTSANAQSITFNNPNCSGYSLTGQAPNQTLTCITGSGAPSGCQITGPTAGTFGTPITLTSSCTGGGAATNWSWNGGNCTGVTTQSCSAVETSQTSRTYTVTASNGSGAGNLATQIVTWGQGGGSGVPSGCTLTPGNQSLSSAGVLGLTAQCTSGTLPITHSFSGAIVGTWQQTSYATGIFIQNNYTQTTSVSVATSNSAGFGNSSTAIVTIGNAGGGGTGLANCAAQGLTVIPANAANVTWGLPLNDPNPSRSSSAGQFDSGARTAWVFKMTVPGNAGFNGYGRFTISEFADPPTPRQISISTTACDFRPRDITGVSGPLAMCSDGQTCEVYYGVTGPSSSAAGLTPGQTYYISARNWQSSGNSCDNTHCNALMTHIPVQ
ncbi:MAG: hypothetical protein ABI748_13165 [Dokdonella sp.]